MPRLSLLILTVLIITLPLMAQRNITESYLAETRGDYDSALSVMQELKNSDPSDGFYQIRIAWLLYLKGNYGDACSAYQEAIRLDDNIDAQTGYVNTLLALGRYAEALDACRRLASLHPENPILLGKGGYAAYQLKDYRSAAEFYAQIARSYPWDMENRSYLMNNLYLSEQEEAAREQYQFLKKYYPQSALLPPYKVIFEP